MLDVERAAIGWRIAKAGDEQDAADFAYDYMDEILAEVARLRAALAEIAMSELLDAHAIAARDALGRVAAD